MNIQLTHFTSWRLRKLGPLPPLLALFVLLVASTAARAQDLVVDSFPNDQSVGIGNTPGLDWDNLRNENVTISWDANQQSPGSTNAGAMYITVDWPETNDPGYTTAWTDIQLGFSTAGYFDSSNYIAFECDIKVDVTNSSLALDGSDYGAIELIVNDPWVNVVGWAQLEATNGWQHFVGYFSSLGSSQGEHDEAIVGLISQGSDTLTNTVSYWIDNIRFTALPAVSTNTPTLSIAKAPPPGLTCICSQGGGTYQRQVVRTVNSDYSWNTSSASSNTCSYSMTIGSFPGPAYTGFEDQMFLIPESGMIAGPADDDIDWDSSDVAAVYVGINSDSSATGTFQYKVNQPSSWNTSLVITQRCVIGAVGTWTLTISNNTNGTLTAPDHSSTNFTINPTDAAAFQNPLFVYLGDQPNSDANIGQSSTFTDFKETGTGDSINDTFVSNGTPGQPYQLNPNIWANDTASDSNGIFVTAPDAKYWLTWPTPDGGFTNVYATDNLSHQLGQFQWAPLPAASTGWLLISGNERLSVINQSTLNAAFGYQPTNAFFGLFHQ